MEPRLNIITLGVNNVKIARNFYETGLGWPISSASNEHIVFIKLQNIVLGLYDREALAKDACLKDKPTAFGGITLAYNTKTQEEVQEVLAIAAKAGAKILKPAQAVFWGGFSGYFSDLDGHPWEVAWNPHFSMNTEGILQLP